MDMGDDPQRGGQRSETFYKRPEAETIQRALIKAMLVANIVRNIFVRNIVRNNLRPVRNICSDLDMGQTPNRSKIDKNLLTSPKVNMLKFGDVSFDLGFEW